MRLKPDYNLESIYHIDLAELKSLGIKAILFDLDSTLMASHAGCYSSETLVWLEHVRKDFFIGVVSNNGDPAYTEKVRSVSDFPVLFDAKKPDPKLIRRFMHEHGLNAQNTVLAGDRPLTDILCGKNLGCKTILVDSITAKTENRLTRFVRKLERLFISD
ncbi:MAG: YqeG family HAD IIIA-type phosphatase [Heliobacteriaceae bacterium]|nr:YqeG family HAD IIIA-type phosphatase [Heliobacteriaceae bacterium]